MLRYLSIILIIHKDIQKFIEEEIYLVKFYQRTSISIFKDAGYKYRLDLIKDIEMMNENNFHQSISRFDEFESGKGILTLLIFRFFEWFWFEEFSKQNDF